MSLRAIEGLVYDYLGNPGWGDALFQPCAVCGTRTKMGAWPAGSKKRRLVPVCGSCWEDRPDGVRYVALERPLSRSNAPRTDEEAPAQAEVRPGGDRAVQGRSGGREGA